MDDITAFFPTQQIAGASSVIATSGEWHLHARIGHTGPKQLVNALYGTQYLAATSPAISQKEVVNSLAVTLFIECVHKCGLVSCLCALAILFSNITYGSIHSRCRNVEPDTEHVHIHVRSLLGKS